MKCCSFTCTMAKRAATVSSAYDRRQDLEEPWGYRPSYLPREPKEEHLVRKNGFRMLGTARLFPLLEVTLLCLKALGNYSPPCPKAKFSGRDIGTLRWVVFIQLPDSYPA